jgi:hypothetical protein
MGHHLFIHDGKSLPMGDGDVALVRHFLIEGASGVGDQSVASAIADWEYQGPGVWVGVDETALIDCGPVFVAAIEVVEGLGKHISLDYLHEKVTLPGGRWLKAQPTADVVARIRGLEEHLHGRT